MTRVLPALVCLFAVASLARAADPNAHEFPKAASDVLKGAKEFELLSLEPSDNPKADADKLSFRGYKVLGKTTVKGDAAESLIAAFEKAVADETVTPAKCFEPRHGIRATLDGKTAEFVICFSCSNVTGAVAAENGAKPTEFSLVVGREPLKAFNDALAAAKVPLPEQAK